MRRLSDVVSSFAGHHMRLPCVRRRSRLADFYTPIRAGTDVTFLLGVIGGDNNKVQWGYVKPFTNAAFVVKGG